MRYKDITPLVRRFIGTREGFRKAGFRAEDLFFLLQPSLKLRGKLGGFCNLRTQGKEFNVELGPVPEMAGKSDKQRHDILGEEYRKVCEAINTGLVPPDDLDRMWQESEIHQRPGEFLAALVLKGIMVPGNKMDLS